MEPLGETLRHVAAAMSGALDSWWIIGSAAVRLHGVSTSVADIDLLCSEADAARLCRVWGHGPSRRSEHDLFRSAVFARFENFALPVEIMAGLTVRTPEGWMTVNLSSRELIATGHVPVHVPSRDELVHVLKLFGRDKDLRRAALLAGKGPSPDGV